MVEIVSGIPKIAVVGRPNVGKSSLFNRIIRARYAIVHREVGTTRDRIVQESSFKAKRFLLTDTGGFVPSEKGQLIQLVKEQIEKAVDESDILLFVCDGQSGLVLQDFDLASFLRKSGKKIFLVINKVDNQKMAQGLLDFYQLGLGKPYPASALHNIGIDELLDEVIKEFPETAAEEKKSEPIKVAIIGRPNVGKSSFLNCLLKEERAIVDEVPGTTRDSIDTRLRDGETEFILIDTAGIRHKRKIKEAVDVYGIMRSKEAIERSAACLVLIDGYDGIVTDDLKILEFVLRGGKCCVLCINKWDLIKNLSQPAYKVKVHERASFLKNYPILFTSTKTGYNVYNSIKVAREVIGSSGLKVPTHQLNKLLASFKTKGPFGSRKNKLRINYITQTDVGPPTFLLFASDVKLVSEEQRNFIENLLRKNFGFVGSPIRLEFRGSKGGKR